MADSLQGSANFFLLPIAALNVHHMPSDSRHGRHPDASVTAINAFACKRKLRNEKVYPPVSARDY